PLLEVIQDGNTYSTTDLYQLLARHFDLSEKAKSEILPSGKQKTYRNRIAWAKTYLKKAGLLEQPARAVVRITPAGKQLLTTAPARIDVGFLKGYSEEFADFHTVDRDNSSSSNEAQVSYSEPQENDTPDIVMATAFKSMQKTLAAELLAKVKEGSPDFFEQLVVDLLINMGYGGAVPGNGIVTPSSADGGIDGLIKEDKLGLDVIYIQAKRWENTVQRPEIQKFIGALAQHGAKKGVFITTSGFSKGARDCRPMNDTRIILIDGQELASLMIEHGLGVSIKETYLLKRVDTDYFDGDVV
ncbi:MAG: restriction endonuclease, partial [Bacteroidota bacterium]